MNRPSGAAPLELMVRHMYVSVVFNDDSTEVIELSRVPLIGEKVSKFAGKKFIVTDVLHFWDQDIERQTQARIWVKDHAA